MLTELYGVLLFLIHMEEMEAQRDTAASLRSHASWTEPILCLSPKSTQALIQ